MNLRLMSVIGLCVAIGIVLASTGYSVGVERASFASMSDVQTVHETPFLARGKLEMRKLVQNYFPQSAQQRCQGKRIEIEKQAINTSELATRTKILSGDSNMDSDDWSQLGYQYEIIQNKRSVVLRLEWVAQELNENQTLGDTRLSSSSLHVLYEVDKRECKGATIATVEVGPDSLIGQRTAKVTGQQYGFVPVAGVGMLDDVKIRFDGDGWNDQYRQVLKAHIRNFSVVLD